MRRIFAVTLLTAASLTPAVAETPAPDVLLLQRVRYHMAQTLTNLPNYTCLQTIERSERLAPKKKPGLIDVVRIEVALVEGKELFSWPGSGKFVDTDITDMVKGGAIGNGSFANHARAVFTGGVATYRYEGTEETEGRKLHRWSFSVPQFRSGYHLRDGLHEAVVAYSGRFWVEAATLDAVRLEVTANDIPDPLRLASANNTVQYSRLRIGEADFLLPTAADLYMTDRHGNENINRTTFSHCRQYSGESRLLLDEELTEAKAKEPEKILDAPRDLSLDLALETELPLRQMAVGDPVSGILQKPLKVGTGVVMPKGAVVHGRITRLHKGTIARYPALAIGIRFFEIETPGWRVRIAAALQTIGSASPEFLNSRLVNWHDTEDETIAGSLIFVKQETMQLRRGLRLIWTTRPLGGEDQK